MRLRCVFAAVKMAADWEMHIASVLFLSFSTSEQLPWSPAAPKREEINLFVLKQCGYFSAIKGIEFIGRGNVIHCRSNSLHSVNKLFNSPTKGWVVETFNDRTPANSASRGMKANDQYVPLQYLETYFVFPSSARGY